MSITGTENGFLDLHGKQVHSFSLEIANVGYQRMGDLLIAMLESEAWRSFRDGISSYSFLPGEFDYFLTQRGIRREDVTQLPDMNVKGRIAMAADERRTGEDNYRRRILQVRAENPQIPGRPIEPFGLTKAEAKALANGSAVADGTHSRPALGVRVRRFTNSNGDRSRAKAPAETLPRAERLRRSAVRLDDDDLAGLVDSLKQELARRKRLA